MSGLARLTFLLRAFYSTYFSQNIVGDFLGVEDSPCQLLRSVRFNIILSLVELSIFSRSLESPLIIPDRLLVASRVRRSTFRLAFDVGLQALYLLVFLFKGFFELLVVFLFTCKDMALFASLGLQLVPLGPQPLDCLLVVLLVNTLRGVPRFLGLSSR